MLIALGGAVGREVEAQTTATGQLRAYIEGVAAFTDGHRAEMQALLQILLAGALPSGTGADDAVPDHVEQILRRGQATGEFRAFDPRVLAMAVQRSVEALPFALQSQPELDCAAGGSELATAFDLATRVRPTPVADAGRPGRVPGAGQHPLPAGSGGGDDRGDRVWFLASAATDRPLAYRFTPPLVQGRLTWCRPSGWRCTWSPSWWSTSTTSSSGSTTPAPRSGAGSSRPLPGRPSQPGT